MLYICMINKFSTMVNENNYSKQKLGLDIHGVINAMPDFFAFLSDSFIRNGGEVHIITGGSWTKTLDDLVESSNIRYTHKFSVYDYLLESLTLQAPSYQTSTGVNMDPTDLQKNVQTDSVFFFRQVKTTGM